MLHHSVTFRCLVCGGPTSDAPSLCSSHCRAEADLELRAARARIKVLQQSSSDPEASRELRGLLDRSSELNWAILNSAPPIEPRLQRHA